MSSFFMNECSSLFLHKNHRCQEEPKHFSETKLESLLGLLSKAVTYCISVQSHILPSDLGR